MSGDIRQFGFVTSSPAVSPIATDGWNRVVGFAVHHPMMETAVLNVFPSEDPPMITLASDFGTPYPAAMKGVIAARSDARMVDISHDFPRQDVRTAAFWLREILPYFPPAVHLVVVDPGVGTERAPIALRAGGHALVGPDNGVLWPAATRLADARPIAFEIENPLEPTDPATFHGRDVFAPAAAVIHEHGVDRMADRPELSRIESVVELTFPEPTIHDGRAIGSVLVVDDFGNVITNIPGEFIRDQMGTELIINDRAVPVQRSYAAVPPGDPLITIGSHGNVELAVNQGDGSDYFDLNVDAEVRLTFTDE